MAQSIELLCRLRQAGQAGPQCESCHGHEDEVGAKMRPEPESSLTSLDNRTVYEYRMHAERRTEKDEQQAACQENRPFPMPADDPLWESTNLDLGT